ncbi:ribosome assembly cofactor RimP [Flavicella sp.]|nr:ribosome assembly cofactor RimP [Flavicella sp.]
MDKESVRRLVEAALEENPSLFLIDLQLLPNSKILVEVDGDAGVALNECIRISRAVEGNLDREEEDFSLEVSSPDITKPLQVLRQYQKNIGRTLQVKTLETALEGTLVAVLEESIELEWKAREPKPIGKGKRTVEKKERIAFDAIVEAKVKLIF